MIILGIKFLLFKSGGQCGGVRGHCYCLIHPRAIVRAVVVVESEVVYYYLFLLCWCDCPTILSTLSSAGRQFELFVGRSFLYLLFHGQY